MADRSRVSGPSSEVRQLSDLEVDIDDYVSDPVVRSDMHRVNRDLDRFLSRRRLTRKVATVLMFRHDLERSRATWTDVDAHVVEDYFSRVEEMLYAQMDSSQSTSSECELDSAQEPDDVRRGGGHEDRSTSAAFETEMDDDNYRECSPPSSCAIDPDAAYEAYGAGAGAGGRRTLRKTLTDEMCRCNRRSSVALVIATTALVAATWTLCNALGISKLGQDADTM